jgi:hypothetical protein
MEVGLVFHPEMVRRKLYVSEMQVRTKRSLKNTSRKWQAFSRRLASLTGSGNDQPFELISLSFGSEQASSILIPAFQFERQQNIPFSEHRYFTRAPLQTEDHLKLLDEFEDLLVG